MQKSLRFVLFVLLAFFAVRRAPAQVHSALLTPAQISHESTRLDSSLIPGFSAELRVDRKQSFSLTGEGFAPFFILPVSFDSTSRENKVPASRCGVFLLPPEGPAVFIPTLGYDWLEVETCNELDGVGFVLGNGHPRILLLYTGSTPNAVTTEPVILDWDAVAKRYTASHELSSKMPAPTTIPQMKARLKALSQQP